MTCVRHIVTIHSVDEADATQFPIVPWIPAWRV